MVSISIQTLVYYCIVSLTNYANLTN